MLTTSYITHWKFQWSIFHKLNIQLSSKITGTVKVYFSIGTKDLDWLWPSRHPRRYTRAKHKYTQIKSSLPRASCLTAVERSFHFNRYYHDQHHREGEMRRRVPSDVACPRGDKKCNAVLSAWNFLRCLLQVVNESFLPVIHYSILSNHFGNIW